MKRFGVMVIGCGHIGTEHLTEIYYRSRVKIVAVVDELIERAHMAAVRFSSENYGTDYRQYLNRDDIDIVIIATYANLHLPILKDCLAAGKHVLCEKPIASNEEDGAEFYDVVKASGCKVLVGHILRHNKSYQKIKELISGDAIGELRIMRMVQNHHTVDWKRYTKLLEDASPVLDCGVHYIDIMEWLSGSEIIEVSGIGTRIDNDAPEDNYGLVTVKLSNSCVGYYESGWSPQIGSGNLKEFIGTKGRITLEMQANRHDNREEGDLITLYRSESQTYESINIQTKYKDMYRQLNVLMDMIENGTPASPDMDEVYRAFRIAFIAQRAIKEGEKYGIASENIPHRQSAYI